MMKKITTLLVTALLSFTLSACAIPDLPGPIGIPGIEKEPLSLNS